MKNNSWMLLMGILWAEGILWLVVPALAAMVGVVLGLFAIASWREGGRMAHSAVSMHSNVEDFQRRLSASGITL